jgi:hypothetical protein
VVSIVLPNSYFGGDVGSGSSVTSRDANCALLLLNGGGGAPCSWLQSFRQILPLKPYLSVMDYSICRTVLPLVVRDAETADYGNRSAGSGVGDDAGHYGPFFLKSKKEIVLPGGTMTNSSFQDPYSIFLISMAEP